MGAFASDLCKKPSSPYVSLMSTPSPRYLCSFPVDAIEFKTGPVYIPHAKAIICCGRPINTSQSDFLYVFSCQTFKCTKKFEVFPIYQPSHLALLGSLAPNIITISHPNSLSIWNLQSGSQITLLECPNLLQYCIMDDFHQIVAISTNSPGVKVWDIRTITHQSQQPSLQPTFAGNEYILSTVHYLSRHKSLIGSDVVGYCIVIIDAQSFSIKHRIHSNQFISSKDKSLFSFQVTQCSEQYLFAMACYQPEKGVMTDGFFYPQKISQELLLIIQDVNKLRKIETIDQTAKTQQLYYCFPINMLIESSSLTMTFSRPGCESSRTQLSLNSCSRIYLEDKQVLVTVSKEKSRFYIIQMMTYGD